MGSADRSKLEEAIRHHFHHEEPSASNEATNRHLMDGTVHFRQFLSTLLEKDPKHFRAALARLRSERAPLLVICETLIIPVAEELGRMWCEDQQNFANITAATARLQLLLTSLSDVEGPSFCDEERPRILLMRMPSNDHTLGLSVIASVFHEEGWSVEGGPGLQAGSRAYSMAREGGYRMIGVSVAVGSTVEDISAIVRKIRASCPDPSMSILLGGPSLSNREPELRAAGADIVALDVRQAIQMANTLLKSQD
ncbi:MAG: cobalamin B12-binding domain-containing protein [Alphaproteobacteria bacterium]|nr:cobalamin B12-binding domain-containing protein [Alphaproteobacteria bacterium]